MSKHSFEAIIGYCPVIRAFPAQRNNILLTDDPHNRPGLVTAACEIPQDVLREFDLDGCRCVTELSETGCPLRNFPIIVRTP